MRQRSAAALKINPDAFSTSWHPVAGACIHMVTREFVDAGSRTSLSIGTGEPLLVFEVSKVLNHTIGEHDAEAFILVRIESRRTLS
jgi:hypothetical protein